MKIYVQNRLCQRHHNSDETLTQHCLTIVPAGREPPAAACERGEESARRRSGRRNTTHKEEKEKQGKQVRAWIMKTQLRDGRDKEEQRLSLDCVYEH